MADVIGPNSYRPGQSVFVPEGATCDEHNDREAKYRIVGETDSFGSELVDMCEECYEEYRQQTDTKYQEIQYCEVCKEMKQYVTRRRDPEEGSSGPVYDMCSDCYRNIVSGLVGDDDDMDIPDDTDYPDDDLDEDD
jgi:hypothetical protein